LGGKTDKAMEGLPATITAASSPSLCPVTTLRHHISKTEAQRQLLPEKPLFIYLANKGAHALGSQRIANVMTKTLIAAGIEETTALSLRKTGASTATNKGVYSDLVIKPGRWKSPEVPFNPYIDWDKADLSNTIISTTQGRMTPGVPRC